jgi:phytanoyl-CoA hydroxylase
VDPALSADVTSRIATAADAEVPLVDLAKRPLSHDDVSAYRRMGVLVVRNLLDDTELDELDRATRALIEHAWAEPGAVDFMTSTFGRHTTPIPYKVDYLLDKAAAFRRLAAQPRLLRIVEAITGPSFVPTWETLVFKDRIGGPRLPWHRDCAPYDNSVALAGAGRIVDVGVYLDASSPDNGLRCLPGSNYWPVAVADAAIGVLNAAWDAWPGVSVSVEPGDAVLHNVLTLHAAPETEGSERRVVYYEYRPAEVEIEAGPHDAAFVAVKQRILLDCLGERAAWAPARSEAPFTYRPARELSLWPETPAQQLRVAHADHWTWSHVEPVPR